MEWVVDTGRAGRPRLYGVWKDVLDRNYHGRGDGESGRSLADIDFNAGRIAGPAGEGCLVRNRLFKF